MHRVTKTELENIIDFINHKLYKDVEGKYYTVNKGFNERNYKGKFVLDKIHSGYQLGLIVNDGGGQREIGYYRKTAREMYFFLDGFKRGLVQAKNTLELI
tara:strand:+ start:337 stop:636 length:300 start_codon:yes stop_codon:yes gene_type:complete